MRTLARTLAAALLITGAVGCGGDPPPERQPREVPLRRTGEETEAPPEGLLAPVDEWKANLADLLPKPWKLDRVEQQIVAPHGWTRFKGPRGLLLVFTDGSEEQRLWVMGTRFEGEKNLEDAALPGAKSEEFVLYRPPTPAKGWKHTAAVATALGLK